MKVIPCVQGTEDWLRIRSGHITSSRISDVVAGGRKKGETSITREKYKSQLAAEILTGESFDSNFLSEDMKRGIELEPLARTAYEMREGVEVERVGFVLHPALPRAGCSPDGLVGDCGGIELKCPRLPIHLQYILTKKIPREYCDQIMWQLHCTGRSWWDFGSYCPHPQLSPEQQLFIVRFEPDMERIYELEVGAEQFLKELNGFLVQLGQVEKVMA